MSLVAGIPFLAEHSPGTGVEVQGVKTLHTGGCLFKGM